MTPQSLGNSIKNIVTLYYQNAVPINVQGILSQIDGTINDAKKNNIVDITIILEGIYQALPDSITLKHQLQELRTQVWTNHQGQPPQNFIIQNDTKIKHTRNSVKNAYWATFNNFQHTVHSSDLWETKS